MAVARSLFVGISCAALALAALSLPGAARADSNGAPNIGGTWRGTLTSKYWDQTSSALIHPKKSFKTKVTLTIVQTGDDPTLAVVIAYDDPFPVGDGTPLSVSALSGFVGNFHLSLVDADPVGFALSGEINGRATAISLAGIAATADLTHELRIKLKKQNP